MSIHDFFRVIFRLLRQSRPSFSVKSAGTNFFFYWTILLFVPVHRPRRSDMYLHILYMHRMHSVYFQDSIPVFDNNLYKSKKRMYARFAYMRWVIGLFFACLQQLLVGLLLQGHPLDFGIQHIQPLCQRLAVLGAEEGDQFLDKADAGIVEPVALRLEILAGGLQNKAGHFHSFTAAGLTCLKFSHPFPHIFIKHLMDRMLSGVIAQTEHTGKPRCALAHFCGICHVIGIEFFQSFDHFVFLLLCVPLGQREFSIS